MATPIIHLHKKEQKQLLLKAVRSQIKESIYAKPDFNQIAESLHMSARTLRRHLKNHDLSYQELVTLERKQLATQLVKNSKLTLEQIGMQLGYKDASSFSRAFKSWHGISPSLYQKGGNNADQTTTQSYIEVA